MQQRGMRAICFSSPNNRSSTSIDDSRTTAALSRFGFSPARPSFSEAVMDRTLEACEPVITKWDPDGSNYSRVTSLVYESRREAKEFVKCVYSLQRAMAFLQTERSSSEKLVRGQKLMRIALKRLEKEFYQILSTNRAQLDPELVSTRSSVSRASTLSNQFDYYDDDDEDEDEENEARIAGDSITEIEDASSRAMEDLKLIAECMISCGYSEECLKIYRVLRKSIVDESIYRLGIEKLISNSRVKKMDLENLDLKIKRWLDGVEVALKTLFKGEKILCDHVFGSSSDSIRESIFSDISTEAAIVLFGFPEIVLKNPRRWPEKVFRLLDMYSAIADRWTEIQSIFSADSASLIRDLAVNSLAKLGESIRTELTEFETSCRKESSKKITAGGGIHSLVIESMSYLTLLADYSNVLCDILADSPPSEMNSLMEFFNFPAQAISLHFAWLILVLLCKLDTKTHIYKDASMSYLFLANNLQYIIVKASASNLKLLLGDNWISKHESKVLKFAESYQRLAWGHVIATLPSNPTAQITPDEIKEHFRRFNLSFEEAHRKHSLCVVHDCKLRNDVKASITEMLVPVYREFYNAHRLTMKRERTLSVFVRFAPEDVRNRISDLFLWSNDEPAERSSLFAESSSSH